MCLLLLPCNLRRCRALPLLCRGALPLLVDAMQPTPAGHCHRRPSASLTVPLLPRPPSRPAGSGVHDDPAALNGGPAANGWLPELPVVGMDGAHLARPGAAQLPTGLLPDLFVDPLLGGLTSLQLPLPVHPPDSFMPPLHADSSGGGASGSGDSQSPSHGSGGPAVSIPASAVVTSGPRSRRSGAGGGKAKELTEEQKERIKAKNRRCVLLLQASRVLCVCVFEVVRGWGRCLTQPPWKQQLRLCRVGCLPPDAAGLMV